MDYQQAKNIRGQSLSNIIAETIASGGGIGESIKHGISQKASAKMTGIKETFDPMNIAKFMTGGSNLAPAILGRLTGRSKKDIGFFTGKSKKIDTASKIGPLEKGNEFNDILMKIYAFMKSVNDADIQRREEDNQFAEEKAYEKNRRHKELMEAITGKKYTGNLDKPTATKVKDEPQSTLLDDILDAFGMGKDILNVLKVIGGFVASPLGVAFIGAVIAGTVGAWMVKQIAGDPQGALEGKGGIGMAVAGLGSEGQLPSYDEEQADKAQKKLAEAVDKKGIKSATIPELEAKRDLLISYGKAKSPEVAELDNEIKSRKSKSENSTPAAVPSTPPAVTANESPAPAPALGQKLGQVQSENNNLNIPQSKEDPTSIINNNSVKSYAKNGQKIPMPSVRNTEPTFQNMILYSTRVV